MNGIRLAEISLFFRRLHTMVHAGVSLPNSLTYLEQGEPNPAFHKVLTSVVDTVMKGYPMSQGLKKHPEVFNVLTVEMVVNGEKTGSLGATFEHLAHLNERYLERRQRIGSALAYPLCLFVVMVLVVGLFVTFVAPGDEGLFSVLGDDVPWPSRVLIAISGFVSSPLLMLSAATVVGVAVLAFRRAYHGDQPFRLRVDTMLLRLPVLGRLLTRLETARSLDVMASSLKVGLSIVQALKNSIRVVSNDRFRHGLEQANQAIMNGESLGVALAKSTSIPRFATSLIEVAEEAGELDNVLGRCAAILDEEVNDALNQAVALAEPLLLCVGGLAAGFVAVATFLPIMRLLSNL